MFCNYFFTRFYQGIMFSEFHKSELAIAIAVLTAPNVEATKITTDADPRTRLQRYDGF